MTDEKAYLKPIGKRLADVRDQLGMNRGQFAEAFGAPKRTFEKYEQGLTELPTKLLLWLRDEHHINLTWLMTGEGDPIDTGDLPPAPPEPVSIDQKTLQRLVDKVEEVSDKVDEVREGSRPRGRRMLDFERPPTTIKWYPVNLSAGGGNTPIYGNPGADLNLEELASERLGLPASAMQLFPIRGDSMYPTLADGDLVVIDSRFTFPDDNGIYAFSTDGDTYVKRAEWVDAGRLHWNSDNPDPTYAAIPVVGDELRTMRVFGRVIWTWKPI